MSSMDIPFQSRQNRLLELLEPDDLAALRPHLHPVELKYRMSLYDADRPIPQVYFPLSGVVSLVSTMANGAAAEVGTIGNEGIAGLPVVFGDSIAPVSVYVQVPGAGLSLASGVLADGLRRSVSMRTVLLHYAHAFFNQVAQTAACNRFHNIEQRCCRWLLMTHDRVQSDHFLLTQEFLGMMLGVQRSSLTLVAHKLKVQKLIEYSRGHVTILDREGLLQRSCECYAANRREFDRLLGRSPGLEQHAKVLEQQAQV